MKLLKSRLAIRTFIGFLLCVSAAEMTVRLSHITDFPVFSTDAEIGYIPAISQSGRFNRTNDWVVNDRNMGIDRDWAPQGTHDLMLLGDSLVWGGNPYKQSEKLGGAVQSSLPEFFVWPLGAGSWSVENPQAWFRRNADIVRELDRLVWVINTSDFAPTSQWTTDMIHPRSRPLSAFAYVFRKYVLPTLGAIDINHPAASKQRIDFSVAARWGALLAAFEEAGIECIVVLYPEKPQFLKSNEPIITYNNFVSVLSEVVPDTVPVLEVMNDVRWQSSFYNDGIHPTPAGNQVLGDIIADAVRADERIVRKSHE